MSVLEQAPPVTVRRQRVTFIVHALWCNRCNCELRQTRSLTGEGEVIHCITVHEYRCPKCGARLTTPTEYPYSHREVEIP